MISNAVLTMVSPIIVLSNPLGNHRDAGLNDLLANRNNNSPDITSWLVGSLNTNASGPFVGSMFASNQSGLDGKIAATLTWTMMVEPNAPWDYKVDFNKYAVQNVIIGGQEYSMEAVANITFGYLGKASGFSDDVLFSGAGIAQAGSDLFNFGKIHFENFPYNFDQPDDQRAIDFGVLLYDKFKGKPLTEADLIWAINEYGELLHPPVKEEKKK